MNIGYFRFVEDNIRTRELNAIAHNFHGLNLIFFGPKDIDMENNLIEGKIYTPDGWKNIVAPLPKIINNMRFNSKNSNSQLYHYLNNNSTLLFHRFGTKDEVEHLLKENNLLTDLLIPSVNTDDKNKVLKMLDNHHKLIFKPVDGQTGQGIFTIEKNDDGFFYNNQNTTTAINKDDLDILLNSIETNHLAQKYIQSITPNGLPFDIRVHYEKNGNGRWVKAQTYARVGITNPLVSNIAKGGTVIRAGLFLRNNFGEDKGKELMKKLNEMLKGFPTKFEKLFEFNVSTIAIDLGLHEDKFYLFEINSFPGGTFARGEVAKLRSAYTRYLANKLFDTKTTSYHELQEEIILLKKKNEKLNKKVYKITNSRSWRYTSIFRRKI